MPRAFPNAYAYQSPIGQGLQNIAQMLLADDGGAKAAVMAAQGQAHQAQAAKYRADAEQTALQTHRTRNFLDNFANNLVGADGPQALRYYQGATETIPAREDPERQMTMAPTTARVQRPASLDDAKLQMLSRAALLAAAPSGGAGVSMENMAQGLERLGKTQAYDGVLSGTVDPSRYTIAEGKPLYHFGEGYAGNVATGAQNLNELGKAKVATEGTKQLQDRAQASNAYASAGAHNRTNQLTAVPHPLDPTKTILVPTNTVYTEYGKNTRGTDKNENDLEKERQKREGKLPNGEKPINLNAESLKFLDRLAQAALNEYAGTAEGLKADQADTDQKTGINPNIVVDPNLKMFVMGEATRLYRDPASGFGGNLSEAVRQAMRNAVAGGAVKGTRTDYSLLPTDRKVKISYSGSQPITTAPSIVPPSQRVENQGASQPAPAAQPIAAIPPPAQRVVGKQYQTPKGMLTWAGTGWAQ
jgi:hypothetical protein